MSNIRYDAFGEIRKMAEAEGYFMVRRKGKSPFILTTAAWASLWDKPIDSSAPKPTPNSGAGGGR